MKGVIRSQHLITHAYIIVAKFGVSTYIRCVKAVVLSQNKTFLQCVYEDGYQSVRRKE